MVPVTSGVAVVHTPQATSRVGSTRSKALAVDKNPAVAMVLSLVFIGAGQLYNGDVKKGLVMFFGAVLLAVPTGGFAVLGCWVWSGIDAYQVATGKWSLW
ncbi:MAG TPA: hypothetical protein VK509_20960 [Polyangiales bacterium]|nr:hypothetical protein [Polyangiales bacterium]